MKSGILVLLIAMMTVATARAQFKSQVDEQPSASQSLVHPRASISSFLGLLNPDNFMMRHNFSFSYLTGGGKGLSLASYTNSMFYKIADPLNVQFDVTLQGSPFGSYGIAEKNNLSRLYLSRAQLNYKPADNFFIQLQYRELPFYYLGSYRPYPLSTTPGDE